MHDDNLIFLQYQGNYKIKIFERSDFGGQVMELMEDCPDLRTRFHNGDISSVNVLEGFWILHEHPNYSGRQFFLHPGEYRRFSEWGSTSTAMGSLKRITQKWSYLLVMVFQRGLIFTADFGLTVESRSMSLCWIFLSFSLAKGNVCIALCVDKLCA